MDYEQESTVHIGQSRRGGGGAPRPKTLKTKADLNAAMRMGDVASAKKIGSANAVSLLICLYKL